MSKFKPGDLIRFKDKSTLMSAYICEIRELTYYVSWDWDKNNRIDEYPIVKIDNLCILITNILREQYDI